MVNLWNFPFIMHTQLINIFHNKIALYTYVLNQYPVLRYAYIFIYVGDWQVNARIVLENIVESMNEQKINNLFIELSNKSFKEFRMKLCLSLSIKLLKV